MSGGGVSAVVKLPLSDTLQQSHVIKPLLGGGHTPTYYFCVQCFALFLIHDCVCSGTQESQAMVGFLTRLKKDVVLECCTWNAPQKEVSSKLLSLGVLRWARTLVQPQFAGAAAEPHS